MLMVSYSIHVAVSNTSREKKLETSSTSRIPAFTMEIFVIERESYRIEFMLENNFSTRHR